MTKDEKLDALLGVPLPPVDDMGFSPHVTARIVAAHDRRMMLETCGLLAALAIFLAVLPLSRIVTTIERLTFDLGSSLPFAMAVLAIVLTASFTRLVAD